MKMTPLPKKRTRKPRVTAPVELPQTPEDMESLLEKGRQAGAEAEAMINELVMDDIVAEYTSEATEYDIWYNIFRYLFTKSRNIGGELHLSRPFVRRIQTLLGKQWEDMSEVDKDWIHKMMRELPK